MGARLLVLVNFLQLLACSHSRARLNMLDCSKSCFVANFLYINDKSVMTKRLKHPYIWFKSVFNSSACYYCGGAVCIIGKTYEAPQQVSRLLFYSLSYFIGAAGFLLSKVLAARKKNLSNALLACSQMLAKTILYRLQCVSKHGTLSIYRIYACALLELLVSRFSAILKSFCMNAAPRYSETLLLKLDHDKTHGACTVSIPESPTQFLIVKV